MNAIISHISENSMAQEIGLQKGDILLEVNGHHIRDAIDFMYYFSKKDVADFKFRRGSKTYSFKIKKRDKKVNIGFELKPFKIRFCRNKCIFCFVDQLPRGMRKSLYLKDEDYRMSFLYGNYITLTNLTPSDKARIMEQKLSPLYISVHTTNDELRRKMLNNPRAPNILEEIHYFTSHKIRMHTQIVLCPGINDGNELSRTIQDLQRFYPYVSSIAVVPVGITGHRKTQIKSVDKTDALKAIEVIKKFRSRLKKRHGDPIIYPSDELYIKAEVPFPPISEYGDLPQIENGVGMLAQFIHGAKQLKLPKKIETKKMATFTGTDFMPYLEEFAQRLRSIEGLTFDIFKVENKFLGPSVTVAGLLTGKDILKAVMGKTNADCLLVPNVTLRNEKDKFLDNITMKDMEESLGMHVRSIESTPEGLLKEITNGCQWED